MVKRGMALKAFLILAATTFSGLMAANAQDQELIEACIQPEAGGQQECACFAEKLNEQTNEDERIFALAILSGDESKLDPIRGKFTNEDAQAMQGKTMSALFECMSG